MMPLGIRPTRGNLAKGGKEIGGPTWRDDYTGNQYDDSQGLFDMGQRGTYSRGADKRRK